MGLACLIYIAQSSKQQSSSSLLEIKDTNTRYAARNSITGVLFLAGHYVFEIMEGEYGALEHNLDRVSCQLSIEEPEIILFASVKARQFQSWKMGVLDASETETDNFELYEMLGAQAQADPQSIPTATIRLIQQFKDQFGSGTSSQAA